MEKTINVVEYSEYPGPRYVNQGPFSGEDFYNKILNPAFAKMEELGGLLVVNLDQTAGYASSFIDEAFGELTYDFSAEKVNKHLKVISINEPFWSKFIQEKVIPIWEQRRINKDSRKTTETNTLFISALINGQVQKIKKE